MDYQDWMGLFGRDSEDAKLKDTLAKAGVSKVPPLKQGEVRTNVQLGDAMLMFSAGELFPSRNTGGDGSSLLSGVILPLEGYKWGKYAGALPFQLSRGDSQAAVRTRLGEPLESDEDFFWDEWMVDQFLVRVTYTENLGSLAAVSVKLPPEA
jgi:hypothetical protein